MLVAGRRLRKLKLNLDALCKVSIDICRAPLTIPPPYNSILHRVVHICCLQIFRDRAGGGIRYIIFNCLWREKEHFGKGNWWHCLVPVRQIPPLMTTTRLYRYEQKPSSQLWRFNFDPGGWGKGGWPPYSVKWLGNNARWQTLSLVNRHKRN